MKPAQMAKESVSDFLLDFRFPGVFRNALGGCIAINDIEWIEWPRPSAQHVSLLDALGREVSAGIFDKAAQ